MTGFQKIALMGRGFLGSAILEQLLSAGYSVTVLGRSEKSKEGLPANAKFAVVDYESIDSLESALRGHDVAISTAGMTAISGQKLAIDACIRAGVKRYIPNDWGSVTTDPEAAHLPFLVPMKQTQEYLTEKAEKNEIEYTIFSVGAFTEYVVKGIIGFNFAEKTIQLFDDGNGRFSTTSVANIGKAVAAALEKPEETKNRNLFINDLVVSQRQLASLAKKYSPPGTQWTETSIDSKAQYDRLMKELEQGPDPQKFLQLLITVVGSGMFGAAYKRVDNELVGLPLLTEEDLDAKFAAAYDTVDYQRLSNYNLHTKALADTMPATVVQRWVTRQDGVENLFRDKAPLSRPGRGEVLVKINAVSLNYRDVEVAVGEYNHHQSVSAADAPPVVPCADMCGVVVEAGEGADWAAGDRVVSTFNQAHLTGQVSAETMRHGLGLPLDGVLQTHRVFPSTGLVPAPRYMSDEEAATLPIAALTAWMAINQFRPLGQPGGKGEVVLLQGTGGVSISGLQIAHAAGATTIITSSSDAKLEKAKALGADHVINYRSVPDWDKAVMEITHGNGADIILECGGAQTLRKSFRSIAFGGLIASIGYVSGKEDDEAGDRTSINLLALLRTATLKGIINGPRDRFLEMLKFYEEHEIHPVIDRIFNFEEGKDAFKYLQSGAHVGKVVIRVNSS